MGADVAAALGTSPGALCVNEGAQTWFMETPGGAVAVGDACAMDAAHTTVALVNHQGVEESAARCRSYTLI